MSEHGLLPWGCPGYSLLPITEASSSLIRRGIDCCLWGSPCRMACSKFVCATASSSRLSETMSNSVKIAGTCPLSSWQRRFRRAARKIEKIAMQDVPASRLSNMHRSGGVINWTWSWERTVRSAMLFLRVPVSSRADASCSSSSPSMANRTFSVDGEANERSSRELTRMGRLSSSIRRFRRPPRPGTSREHLLFETTRAMLARVSFSGTFR